MSLPLGKSGELGESGEPGGLDEAAQAAIILRGYRAARVDFGLNRIQLGAHLHLIKDHKIWRGLADSWEEFLASENLNPHASRQYINVAKKFVFDLDLDDLVLKKLAMAGISALEKAARVINDENKDQILSDLTTLSERDAIQRLLDISAQSGDELKPAQSAFRVLRMLKEYHELPPDLQQDFRHRLGGHEQIRRQRSGLVQEATGQGTLTGDGKDGKAGKDAKDGNAKTGGRQKSDGLELTGAPVRLRFRASKP